ncbi:MAG: hypothetical protein JWO24_2513 [Rhodospirillales bacterium]|nr:hypothetical protein [Rhodospirillales bacterium]
MRVLDAACWLKGCSSLGRLRLAVLAGIGKGKAGRHCLMDVKEAVSASAPRSADATTPRDSAERVVMGARSLSSFLGERMVAARLLGKSVFIRELLPQDRKLEIEHLSCDEAMNVADFLSQVVGRAHARQMNASDRKQWLAGLQRKPFTIAERTHLALEQRRRPRRRARGGIPAALSALLDGRGRLKKPRRDDTIFGVGVARKAAGRICSKDGSWPMAPCRSTGLVEKPEWLCGRPLCDEPPDENASLS